METKSGHCLLCCEEALWLTPLGFCSENCENEWDLMEAEWRALDADGADFVEDYCEEVYL